MSSYLLLSDCWRTTTVLLQTFRDFSNLLKHSCALSQNFYNIYFVFSKLFSIFLISLIHLIMLTRLLDKNNLKFHCNSFCTPQAIQFKELRHQLRSLAGISAQQIKLKHIHKLLVVFMKNHKCSNYALSESKTRKEDVTYNNPRPFDVRLNP